MPSQTWRTRTWRSRTWCAARGEAGGHRHAAGAHGLAGAGMGAGMHTWARAHAHAHTQVREQEGIPPLVVLLEALDIKVQQAAAGALRTLAFKNEGNKEQVRVRAGGTAHCCWRRVRVRARGAGANACCQATRTRVHTPMHLPRPPPQIVECGALPTLIQMLCSEDQGVHYEAVGVLGNLVHSSQHIKRKVRARVRACGSHSATCWHARLRSSHGLLLRLSTAQP